MSQHPLNANRIFGWLFLFTALEVGLSMLVEYGGVAMPRWAYWGGLCGLAFLKGLLIAKEFMHLKFEGWIVKGLILPTPFLMIVIYFVLTGDISQERYEDGRLRYPIGSYVDASTGQVVTEFPRGGHGTAAEQTDGESGDHGAEAGH